MNSVGEITADPASGPQFKKITIHSETEKEVLYWMNIVMLVGIFWIWEFKSHYINLVAMISASTYYFDSGAKEAGQADVKLGALLATKYHIGSIALGSFVIPLVSFFKLIIVSPA